MKAIVISDSHGDGATINMILTIHSKADAVIFLGDGENDFFSSYNSQKLTNKQVVAVCGNCDYGSQLPKEEVFCFGGKKVFALHGHTKSVKSGLERLIGTAENMKADIVIYGHTHSAAVEYINGIYYMCPGCAHYGEYGVIDIDDKTGTVLCHTEEIKRR